MNMYSTRFLVASSQKRGGDAGDHRPGRALMTLSGARPARHQASVIPLRWPTPIWSGTRRCSTASSRTHQPCRHPVNAQLGHVADAARCSRAWPGAGRHASGVSQECVIAAAFLRRRSGDSRSIRGGSGPKRPPSSATPFSWESPQINDIAQNGGERAGSTRHSIGSACLEYFLDPSLLCRRKAPPRRIPAPAPSHRQSKDRTGFRFIKSILDQPA
jgi:hypothetical protein